MSSRRRIITDFIDGSTTTRLETFFLPNFALCVLLKTTEHNRKKNILWIVKGFSFASHKSRTTQQQCATMWMLYVSAEKPKLDSSIFRFRIQQATFSSSPEPRLYIACLVSRGGSQPSAPMLRTLLEQKAFQFFSLLPEQSTSCRTVVLVISFLNIHRVQNALMAGGAMLAA